MGKATQEFNGSISRSCYIRANKANGIGCLLSEMSAVVRCVENLEGLRGGRGLCCTSLLSRKLCKNRIRIGRMDISATPGSFNIFLGVCRLPSLTAEFPEGGFRYTGACTAYKD